ncbi:YkvA family protein [Litorivivens sp.]|uniref:YkvA family protein n=1 Tax=Litorivivens sp. TaxID=2020868 RepID=UPI0035653ED5
MSANNRLERDAANVKQADVTRLLSRWPKLEQMVRDNKRLQPFIEDVNLAYQLLGDYSSRRYREIPWRSIAAIVAALLYVLNPLDMLPDMIPMFGLVDDASVLALCWSMVRKDLDQYRAFLEQHPPG